jgi:hypothetical protein
VRASGRPSYPWPAGATRGQHRAVAQLAVSASAEGSLMGKHGDSLGVRVLLVQMGWGKFSGRFKRL